ncbi:hypothetical protein HK097_005880 [Rhizophlyctis rosea]|uniref:Uncharacterized protein n=1 Tax=Rhizophlyctis rosea TaxID=64517 RepID=A0AAD5SGD7_9FUNG|nr:hypothetical protein HK097_005880 [Rhizophlyctis rosea]
MPSFFLFPASGDARVCHADMLIDIKRFLNNNNEEEIYFGQTTLAMCKHDTQKGYFSGWALILYDEEAAFKHVPRNKHIPTLKGNVGIAVGYTFDKGEKNGDVLLDLNDVFLTDEAPNELLRCVHNRNLLDEIGRELIPSGSYTSNDIDKIAAQNKALLDRYKAAQQATCDFPVKEAAIMAAYEKIFKVKKGGNKKACIM